MKEKIQISEAEYEVMKVIWDNEPISTTAVIEKLSDKTSWSPKTIQTMLLRLVKKEVLTYEKQSRVFVYSSCIKKEEYLDNESNSFLNRFYNGTINSMVLNFLESDKLTNDDIDELRNLLEKKKTKE
ncbi:MAG: BlaI/MecI/CopY family transcriptional regulator [Clostridium sp.]